MLITTDVWARGIDVQQVSLVINYDLPAYALYPSIHVFHSNFFPPVIVKITFTVSAVQGGLEGRVWLLT